MKCLGILGGQSSSATADFFSKIIKINNDKMRKMRIVVDNYPAVFNKHEAILYNKNRAEIVSLLVSSIKGLLYQGCDKIIIDSCINHAFLEDIYEMYPYSREVIIDSVSLAKKYIEHKNINELLILASSNSIKTKFFEMQFSNIQLCYMNREHLVQIDDIIFNLEIGKNNFEELNKKIIDLLSHYTCRNVLILCSELSMLDFKEFVQAKVYDLIDIIIGII